MKSIAERIPNFTLYTPHARPAPRAPKNAGLGRCAPKKKCRITLTLCDISTGFGWLACRFSPRYLSVFMSHNGDQDGGEGSAAKSLKSRASTRGVIARILTKFPEKRVTL
jgi:hypothetical protein